jgi:hypothetical protein
MFINLVQFMNYVRDLNLTISLSDDLIMSLCCSFLELTELLEA